MTFIEQKIEELKALSCIQFGTSIEKVESDSRKREISDTRKCISILCREFYPEINGAHIARLIKKERSSQRKLLKEARILIKVDKNFRLKVDAVRKEYREHTKIN